MTVTSHVPASDIAAVLDKSGLKPQEILILPGRAARYKPVPNNLHQKLAQQLRELYPSGLYSHQADTIQALCDGLDVCLATPTASGKSLAFMTMAAEITMRDRFAKVLAVYPAKALIQDQLAKWQQFMDPFGVRVGFIDGSVPLPERTAILSSCRVVAMTPDVVHAWLMSRLGTKEVADFLGRLRLLILDEAHVYDGAFGTNMAYLLRRIAVAAHPHRMVCSSATVGAPTEFMRLLTGRNMTVIDADSDGSALAEKTLLLAPVAGKGTFDRTVQLLVNLVEYGKARFLAFGDSRKAVERIVAAIQRHQKDPAPEETTEDEDDGNEPDDDGNSWTKLEKVLPFRAGYEAEDRAAIQKELTQGTLAGVVSTSALELGLDIGDLDLVVLLNTPATIKAFTQRIGRAGRRRPGICVLLDDQQVMAPLAEYTARKPEPSWLYLDNRYIQYTNALCAAAELQARGISCTNEIDYLGLPEAFRRLVENELNPTEAVSPDLYSLKQKAQGNPHYEFPIRSAAEPNFVVLGSFERKLGTLSYAQVLREAYPGAVYYYMARPFRTYALEFKNGVIKAKRTRYFTTKPLTDNLAFPNFKNGILTAWSSPEGFLCEAELQVSERVKGFVEQRGQKKTSHEYGPLSPYSQKPLNRFFQTTGVCWSFADVECAQSVAEQLLGTFSTTCGIQERDLGIALFKSNEGPVGPTPVAGMVIFDATNGSLRLTELLALQFADIVAAAISQCDCEKTKRALIELQSRIVAIQPLATTSTTEPAPADGDWVRLIDRDEPAMYMHADGPLEVTVVDFRYTPNGIMYELQSLKDAGVQLHKTTGKFGTTTEVSKVGQVKWMVLASHIQPIHGRTRTLRFNLVSGEEERFELNREPIMVV